MKSQERKKLDNNIINSFPTPIAVLYNKLLQEERWELKTGLALELFEVWMKSVTLQMLIQYLDQDIKILKDGEADKLNAKIKQIYKPSLGQIVDLFFSLLKVYRDHPELLFMKELHGIQWQVGSKMKVSGVQDDFKALIPIRNELAHGRSKPRSEEGWRQLYAEVEKLLYSVLSRFQFVKNYRIVYGLEAKAGQGVFLELRGLEPSRVELEMSGTEAVQPGRFYLDCDRDEGCFYELHPLFLPWPSDFLDWEKREVGDDSTRKQAAIYDSYIKNKIHYAVHTDYVKDLVLTDEETIARFLELFEESLKQIQPARSVSRGLHWREFREIVGEITKIETEVIREKYSKDLYLQREYIKSAFEHFLETNKVAFVLLGQSGVGKSNFVLSMYEAYRESQDTHLIVLNSARLSGEEKLVSSMTEKFVNKIALVEKNGRERQVEDILEEINLIDKINEKKIILVFDAINENSKPQELLKRIDELVSYNKYPWLKVMITSRPEAWQSMKRQYRLTESKYYRQPDAEEIEMELRGFDQQAEDGWLAMDRFEVRELPRVYRLYQEQFHLQTDFDVLSPDMKVMLRDPLALRLVAETYGSLKETSGKNGILPESVRTSQLYEKYINSLINDGRLERSDIRVFLEKKLLPLMFQPGKYRNTLDSEVLTETIDPTSGKSLSEEIELTDILPSTGKRVNQSFQNLADAGMVIKQGADSDYEISFKYERFYDYFGGRHLFETAPEDKAKIQWYRERILEIAKTPYLWGPARQALFLELHGVGKQQEFPMVFDLLKLNEPSVQDLLESTLIWYARDYAKQGQTLLFKLYANHRSSIRRLALRVAGFAGIPEVLELAGTDRDKHVRLTCIQSSYYFWQHNPGEGWHILEGWAEQVRGRFYLPNKAATESCFGLSVMILTDRSNSSKPNLQIPDYQNPEIAERLQSIWRKILSDLLYVSEGEIRHSTVRTGIRSMILTVLIRFMFLIMKGGQKKGYVRVASPLPYLEKMFKRDASERGQFLKLRPYWNESNEGLESIEDQLIECFDPENTLSIGAIVLLIQLRAKRDGDQDLKVVERVYHHYFDPKYPTMAPAQLVFNSGYVLRREPTPPTKEAWDIYTRLQKSYLDVGGMYYGAEAMVHECSYMELYSSVERQFVTNSESSELLVESVEESVEQYRKTRDLKPMPGENTAASIPATIFTFEKLGIVYRNASIALDAMKPIIKMLVEDVPEEDEDDQNYNIITQQLGETLARFRLYYSNQVDNLLEDTNAPDKLRQIMKTTVVEEDLWGDYLAYRFGPLGLKTVFVPQIRETLWTIFELSLETNSIDEWFNLSLRHIVNFIYGGQVFPTDV
jgi:hypothetical protein